MTPEQRWHDAFAAEEREPSDWTPDVAAFTRRLRGQLMADGCDWADFAVAVVAARASAGADRASFAQRLGLDERALCALEGAEDPGWHTTDGYD